MKKVLQRRLLILIVAGACLLAVGLASSRRLIELKRSPQPVTEQPDPARSQPRAEFQTTTAPDPGPITARVIAGGGGTSTGGSIRIDGTIAEVSAGNTLAGGSFTLRGGFWSGLSAAASTPTPSPTPTPTPTATPTPTPPPGAAIILIEEGTANRAVALDSVTFVRGPFPVLTDHNFSADHHTRVILFTSNLGLTQPNPSVLTVQAAGFDLPVENVGGFFPNGLNASYVIVRLPDGLPAGDLSLTVTFHGVMSNAANISISP